MQVTAPPSVQRTDSHSVRVRLARGSYRLASLLINLDRRVRKSHGRGVKLVLTDADDRILLVRHTYGRRHWTFPGGGVRTNEAPESAAVRETDEELGIAAITFDSLGTYPARSKRRIDVVSVFRGQINPAKLLPSRVELAAVGLFARPELPDDIDPNVNIALGLLDGRNAELVAARRRTV